MSLQSDFELCLEYAQALESKQLQRQRAQNNIIFMQNESERLKNKLKICTTLSTISGAASAFFAVIMISLGGVDAIGCVPFLLISVAVLLVSLFVRTKLGKESAEFEAQKPRLLQQYTEEAQDCESEIIDLIGEIRRASLLDIVPAELFCVEAIAFCLTQVRKKLANTAEEAFRQLDREIRRLEQLEYLEEMNAARMEELEDIKRAIHVNSLITLAEQNRKYS